MTDVKLDLELAQQSLVFIFASMVVYTVSFLIFAWHLTNIASNKGSGAVISTKLENIGFALFGFGALIHGAGVVMRGIAASRVPWANMYEFSISGAFVLVAIFLAFYRLRDIRIIAAFVNGFVLLILGAATTYFYVQVKTLMPALQSYWLVIHVTVAVLATAFFNIAAASSKRPARFSITPKRLAKAKSLGLRAWTGATSSAASLCRPRVESAMA